MIEAVLRPGDCLYLPRGFLHAATALGGVSTHLTIGVHSWTRYGLAEQLVQQALRRVAQDPSLRASLPLGVSFDHASTLRAELEAAQQALSEALERLDADAVTGVLRRQARDSSRAAPVGPLRQLRAADGLTSTTTLSLRPQLAATLDQDGRGSVIRSRSADFPLGEEDVAPVKALLETGAATAESLGMELARRMVLAGLAVVG